MTAERLSVAVALLEKMLRPYLGEIDWYAWAMRHAALAANPIPSALTARSASWHWTLARAAAVNAVVDLVAAYDAEALGEHAPRVRCFLSLACVDLQVCLDDEAGWLAWAALARRVGDLALEQDLLRASHVRDSATFWTRVQAGYRFLRPLTELAELVGLSGLAGAEGGEAQPDLQSRTRARVELLYFPDYTGNAYLRLLYAPLVAAGAKVRGSLQAEDVLEARITPGADNILHLHWVNPLFLRAIGDEQAVVRGLERFLAGLARQQAQGFRVFWTIHNHLSHEQNHPLLERKFRQDLYRLADRIFIHHPLAASLLDWLPDQNKLTLAEHGPYPVAPAQGEGSLQGEGSPQGEGRQRARQALGFGADEWVLSSIGWIRSYKDLTTYLPVLRDALEQHPQLRIVIAGVLKSPQVKAWLDTNAHPRLNVRNGYLSDQELDTLMQASNAGLLTYDRILTSGTLFHWLSAGRPVLAPHLGTVPAYVIDGWNGWFYHNPSDLQAKLAHMIHAPPATQAYWTHNARQSGDTLQWRLWGRGKEYRQGGGIQTG